MDVMENNIILLYCTIPYIAIYIIYLIYINKIPKMLVMSVKIPVKIGQAKIAINQSWVNDV